jgi:hypothetical protein
MKNLVLSFFALSMLSLALAGCNKAPDTKGVPDSENSLMNPGAIKMGENVPSYTK